MNFMTRKNADGSVNELFILMTHDGVISCVPNDPANRHWQMYQEWCAEGNVATEEPTQSEGV